MFWARGTRTSAPAGLGHGHQPRDLNHTRLSGCVLENAARCGHGGPNSGRNVPFQRQGRGRDHLLRGQLPGPGSLPPQAEQRVVLPPPPARTRGAMPGVSPGGMVTVSSSLPIYAAAKTASFRARPRRKRRKRPRPRRPSPWTECQVWPWEGARRAGLRRGPRWPRVLSALTLGSPDEVGRRGAWGRLSGRVSFPRCHHRWPPTVS